MLRPHEELPEEVNSDKSFTKIFLAGTIDMGNSRDWQMELLDRFSEMLQHTWEKCEGVGTEIVYIYLATCTPESAWVYRD